VNKANKINFYPDSEEIISNNVRYLRKKNGLTQTELGKKVGVTKQQIGHVERGNFPSMKVLFNLIYVFNIPRDNVYDFFFEDLSKLDYYKLIQPRDENVSEPIADYEQADSSPIVYDMNDLPMILDRMQADIRKLKSRIQDLENG